jgi:hypothetical protein
MTPHRPSRSRLAARLLLLLLLLPGCALWCGPLHAAPPTPPVTDTTAATGITPRPSVFVLFDVEMEAAALGNSPPAVRQAREAARQQAFDAITARLKAWGERNGVTLETAVFSSRSKINLGGRSFNHLLVEKISQAALEDGGADGTRVSTRKWTAAAYDTSIPGAKAPAKLGSDSFLSDGSACFESDAPALADCRSAYLRLLSQHLRWIDAGWGEVDAAAAAAPRN